MACSARFQLCTLTAKELKLGESVWGAFGERGFRGTLVCLE